MSVTRISMGSVAVAEIERLAAYLALFLRTGDLIALDGPLGAGKTTFARALISSLSGGTITEVPSPTYTLLQSYDCGRLALHHFDLYRLGSADDLRELGIEAALADGVAVVEWPDRLGGELSRDRFTLALRPVADPELRDVVVEGHGSAGPRIERLRDMIAFVVCAGFGDAVPAFLEGDASRRSYARLHAPGKPSLVLMDSPKQPEGPPARGGRSYSQIAHLAEEVRPFVAIGGALRRGGLSAPEVVAHDLDRGFLILEDLGELTFSVALSQGVSQAELYRAATNVLLEMRRMPPGRDLPLPDGGRYSLPRFDRAALEIEIDLLLDWYWPEVKGAPVPEADRAEFYRLWSPVLDRILAEPGGWFLRDFHSPNLIWLGDRDGVARVGLLDYQDALAESHAYDLVSLLQDNRLDVPAELEAQLLAYYCTEAVRREPGFDEAHFRSIYAAFGAQRHTRIVGLWIRLLRRDGKPGYLRHMARAWDYLARNLAHPDLSTLRAWYDTHLPHTLRTRRIVP
ncbi:MAG: tRNA (adenosine(37)-N6)-threonylcarbamoyltransferase complex ATPase subunit type 1 TsaE [Hyphomicrobiaceae bacterium]